MKILLMGAELFNVDRRADGRTDRRDEANSCFSQFYATMYRHIYVLRLSLRRKVLTFFCEVPYSGRRSFTPASEVAAHLSCPHIRPLMSLFDMEDVTFMGLEVFLLSQSSWLALRSTHRPVRWAMAFFPGYKASGAWCDFSSPSSAEVTHEECSSFAPVRAFVERMGTTWPFLRLMPILVIFN